MAVISLLVVVCHYLLSGDSDISAIFSGATSLTGVSLSLGIVRDISTAEHWWYVRVLTYPKCSKCHVQML